MARASFRVEGPGLFQVVWKKDLRVKPMGWAIPLVEPLEPPSPGVEEPGIEALAKWGPE